MKGCWWSQLGSISEEVSYSESSISRQSFSARVCLAVDQALFPRLDFLCSADCLRATHRSGWQVRKAVITLAERWLLLKRTSQRFRVA